MTSVYIYMLLKYWTTFGPHLILVSSKKGVEGATILLEKKEESKTKTKQQQQQQK